jgi:peptide/nickel transport system substrate-binding protein
MNKEPIVLYIFRLFLSFALLFFMGMLYWSETIVESNMIELRSEISLIKNELETIRRQGFTSGAQNGDVAKKKRSDVKTSSKYPNLLKKDPFYETTLPKLLGDGFKPHGIQHLATVGKPENLHPFANWADVVSWQSLCNVAVGGMAFGKYEALTSDMGLRMEERVNPETGIKEFWIFLRNDVFWQPLKQSFFSSGTTLSPHFLQKHQVTAHDFKFYFDAMMNPYVQMPGVIAMRSIYSGIKQIEVIDDFTFVVRWTPEVITLANGEKHYKLKYVARQLTAGLRPLASFVYKYFSNGKKIVEDDSHPDTYRTNSVWAQNFAEHFAKNIIVSCGAWVFDGMNERQIKFVRNKDFYDPLAALTEGIEIDIKDSPDNVWQEFKSNHLDSFTLQPDQKMEFQDFLQSPSYKEQAKNGDSINQLDYVMRAYSYIAWNEARPFFKSKKVRQALTMAIDRQRIIDQILNGMGVETTGTFYRYSPAYDTSIAPWPYSPRESIRALAEEGWRDLDGDGVIDKMIDGEKVSFRFTLNYYVKNPTTKAICEYISTALKEVGIDCRLDGVDIADLSSLFDDKSFDALSMAWALATPPEDPRQLWYSSGAKEKGSSNAIGFANSEIDAIIDQLDFEYDQKKRVELYHRFDAILNDEQPYTFLYTPKRSLLYRNYLQNVFLPVDRQDLVPGANAAEPSSSIFWLKK